MKASFPTILDFLNTVFEGNLMRCKNRDPSSDAMWNFNSHFNTKLVICLKIWGVVKKLIRNLTLFKFFDSKDVYFCQNTTLRNKLSKNVGKRHFWNFYGVNWPKSNKFFESDLSKFIWFFKMSSTWKTVALLKFLFKIWRVIKRMFHNPTRCKKSDSKNDE